MKLISYSLKWALTALFIYISANLLFFFLDIPIFSTLRVVVLMAAFVAITVLALMYYREKELNGYAQFTDLLKVGLSIFAILSVSIAIWELIYPLYIDTGYYQKLLEQSEIILSTQDLSKEEIAKGLENTKLNFAPQKRFFSNVSKFCILGLILSFPVSLILRKSSPEETTNQL